MALLLFFDSVASTFTQLSLRFGPWPVDATQIPALLLLPLGFVKRVQEATAASGSQ